METTGKLILLGWVVLPAGGVGWNRDEPGTATRV
jgi:hypothetical protein